MRTIDNGFSVTFLRDDGSVVSVPRDPANADYIGLLTLAGKTLKADQAEGEKIIAATRAAEDAARVDPKAKARAKAVLDKLGVSADDLRSALGL